MQASHSLYTGQSMNSTAAQFLQAATKFVNGEKQLAVSLGIAQSLPGKLTADLHHTPGPLLLRAVDIVLAHPQSPIPLAATRMPSPGGGQ
jgi:hypothetical protein